MKKILITSILLLSITYTYSQKSVEDYVKEGIQYHDSGNYDKAIATYKKALKIYPSSTLVNYEISMSYFGAKQYKKAIEFSDKVLDQNADYMIQAYMTKGSALDVSGKTKESIMVFEKAIKKTEGHYLLHYNLALNYYKINEFDNAELNVIKAIGMNPNHASSHLMLAKMNDSKGNSVQTLLSIHYFLFLEANSTRSLEGYDILQRNFGGNVSKDENKPNTINIMLSPNDDSQFGAAELMISLLEASRTLEENEGKSDDEIFIENTESFFKVLGELKKDKNKEIWWTFYTPFFYDIAKSDHLETYCKYISQVENESSKKWLSDNNEKLSEFDNWLKNN